VAVEVEAGAVALQNPCLQLQSPLVHYLAQRQSKYLDLHNPPFFLLAVFSSLERELSVTRLVLKRENREPGER